LLLAQCAAASSNSACEGGASDQITSIENTSPGVGSPRPGGRR
jgi:hypothetical protein